ncbi:MAG: hypothetical protein M0R33_17300 [Methylomonas sp.]|nr:hypothetical protein [Methylomonas sp.]
MPDSNVCIADRQADISSTKGVEPEASSPLMNPSLANSTLHVIAMGDYLHLREFRAIACVCRDWCEIIHDIVRQKNLVITRVEIKNKIISFRRIDGAPPDILEGLYGIVSFREINDFQRLSEFITLDTPFSMPNKTWTFREMFSRYICRNAELSSCIIECYPRNAPNHSDWDNAISNCCERLYSSKNKLSPLNGSLFQKNSE